MATWQRTRAFLTQDAGALTDRIVAAADRRIGVRARRAAGTVALAASLAAAALSATYSRPIEPSYRTETVSYTIADTISAAPKQHVVRPGESLWKILAVAGEPAQATAARVKEVCASNTQLSYRAIDNRSVRAGRLSHSADGIPCDYLPAGVTLTLPGDPLRVVERRHEAVLYHQQAPGREYVPFGVFLATLCTVAAVGSSGLLLRHGAHTAPQPAAAPRDDPHAKYKPRAISI